MHAGAGRVERKLADRDAHAQRAEIPEPEDALAVGDDDETDALDSASAQHFGDAAAIPRA